MPKDSSEFCYIPKACFTVDDIYFHLLPFQMILNSFYVHDMNALIKVKRDIYICTFQCQEERDTAKESGSRFGLFEVRPMLDPLKTPQTAKALQ